MVKLSPGFCPNIPNILGPYTIDYADPYRRILSKQEGQKRRSYLWQDNLFLGCPEEGAYALHDLFHTPIALTVPDFYVGPNGKALPSQYKDWIGTNIQKELLEQAENPQLQNAIKQLYIESKNRNCLNP